MCHNELGRAPMLGNLADILPERLKDPRYKGAAEDLEAYLIESLIEPSAFVVAGFGKKGSNDAESPMPNVAGGSIGLAEAEVAAVVAYLQDSSGAEVTVEIPTDADAVEAEEEAEEREAITEPDLLMAKFTCPACHKINGQGGDVGPELSKIGASRDRAYLRRALLDPNGDIAEGFEADMMPDDLGEQMFVTELEVLLDFLTALK